MGVPKRKNSKSRRDKRTANKGLDFGSVARCQTCQEAVAPHQVCPACGYYKGVKVLRTKTDRIHERGQKRNAEQARNQVTEPTATEAEAPKSKAPKKAVKAKKAE